MAPNQNFDNSTFLVRSVLVKKKRFYQTQYALSGQCFRHQQPYISPLHSLYIIYFIIFSLYVPSFDIAVNGVDIIISSCFCWLGWYFCPVLSVLTLLNIGLTFYTKWMSIAFFCLPPKELFNMNSCDQMRLTSRRKLFSEKSTSRVPQNLVYDDLLLSDKTEAIWEPRISSW